MKKLHSLARRRGNMTREGNFILGIAEVNGGINYYGNRSAYMLAGGTRLVARKREKNSQGRTGPRHSINPPLTLRGELHG